MAETRHRKRGDSAAVKSSQEDVHAGLMGVVKRHLESPWQQPLHGPSARAFEAVTALISGGERGGLVLDSGCGTGESTHVLAGLHPRSVVVGIDKSTSRLSRQGYGSVPRRHGRVVLARADLPTFWRLALSASWRITRHYLLYPNPWPKPGQLRRRWHAHPVFPALMELGGVIEMRCNWRIYAREFAAAAGFLRGREISVERLGESEPLSPHERKYMASGHELFRVVVPAPSPGSNGC